MSTWQKLQVYSSRHKIHYVRTCGEKPSIILPHGFTENGCTRLELAHILEDQSSLLMPDLIGHERSDRLTPSGEINRMPDPAILSESLHLEKTALNEPSPCASIKLDHADSNPENMAVRILEGASWFDKTGLPKIPQRG
ncbi:MAG: alpha/beta hydrolase [Anaerolineaceae bacterium]